MNQSANYPMIAKTMAELEDVLADELISLGATDVEMGTRMVSFSGDKALMYKANIHCRTALRILKPIHEFKAEDADEVYDAVKAIDWDEYMTIDKTFSIDSVVFSHMFKHSKFVAYRVKDAIADWFQEKYGKRPSVSLTNPDLVFNIHISHKTCTLSLDSSGDSLHKRGYRTVETEAPLNEVLAAGMILKSGWRGESTFIDPMCGSGTLLIEAAMIATGTPPGIHRKDFGFEKWNDFDEELFSEIYNDDSSSKEFNYRIIGSDVSASAIAAAEQNVKNAGVKKYVDITLMPIQQYEEAPQPAGVLMTNPPYGERLKVSDLDELYSMIGERLKHVFIGYDSFILSYKKESFDNIGLKPSKRFFLFNGSLECEMREYEIFAGKRNEHDPDDRSESAIRRNERSEKFMSEERNSREGYRRSQRELEQESGEGDDSFGGDRPFRRDDRFDKPGHDSSRGGFGRGDRRSRDNDRSFDRDRSPRDGQGSYNRGGASRDGGTRSFDRNRSFDKDRGSRDGGERSFDRDRRPRDGQGSFNRDNRSGGGNRSFDRDRKPFDKSRSFDRDNKGGFERKGSFNVDKNHFDKRDFFNRDERPSRDGERSFDRDRRPRDDQRQFDRGSRDGGNRSFDRDRKPFDSNRSDSRGGERSFDRDRKPFDKSRSFDRDKRPDNRGGDRSFDSRDRRPKDRSFDKDRRPRDFQKKDFGRSDRRDSFSDKPSAPRAEGQRRQRIPKMDRGSKPTEE